MGNYNDFIDLAITEDWDFELDNGDFALSEGVNCIKDNVELGLKCNTGDFVLEPIFGANMEDLYGMPNTRKTAELGAQRIFYTLTEHSGIFQQDLSINPIPFDFSSILFAITIKTGYKDKLHIPFEFRLEG